MKKLLLTSIIVSALLLACNKQDVLPTINSTTGTWKYIGYSGGLAGLPFMPDDTAKNFIQLDATRLLMNNNGSQNCTAYSFVKDTLYPNTGLLSIKDTAIYPRDYDVHISGDTLTLYPHNFGDAFTAVYIRSLKTFIWCDGN